MNNKEFHPGCALGIAAMLVAATAITTRRPHTDEIGVSDIYSVAPATSRSVYDGRKSVMFIADTSSSMGDELGGTPKIDAERRELERILNRCQGTPNLEAGLVVFENNGAICLVSLGPFNYQTLSARVSVLSADTGTPL